MKAIFSSSENFVTFAYGSNMLTRRIRARCPSATPIGMARLDGHELRWHKRSSDGSGKCNVVETTSTEAAVFGVLFRIALAERTDLDRSEGLGTGYTQKAVTVSCEGERHEARIYVATIIDDSLKPFTWYKSLVVAGALENRLPAEYIAQLRLKDAREDINRERHAKHMALVNFLPDLS